MKIKTFELVLIKRFQSEFVLILAVSLGKILDFIWLIQSFQEQYATCFIHVKEQRVCMIDLVGDTWVSTAHRRCISRRKNNDPFLNTNCTAFPHEAYWTKLTALTFSSRVTLGTVVLSPSGSSVVPHGKSMLWPFFAFYWKKWGIEAFFFLLYYRGWLFLLVCFIFHFPTLFMAINCIILQCLKWMCWQDNGIGFILCPVKLCDVCQSFEKTKFFYQNLPFQFWLVVYPRAASSLLRICCKLLK